MTKRSGGEDLLGLFLAALLGVLILLLVLPLGYVIRATRETRSPRLLAGGLVFLTLLILGIVLPANLLLWAALLTGIATILRAQIEQRRARTLRPRKAFHPFERYFR